MTLSTICLFIVRASMSVAVLAMSDIKRYNGTNIEVFNWDKKTQSIILSSFFWGYLVMQIPAGILAKKFGGKPTILVALLANGVICLLVPMLAAWGGWRFVCAARVVIGLTQSFTLPASHTLLGQWLPASERTNCTTIVFGGTKVGVIAAMALCGILAESALGWKLIFYSISGMVMLQSIAWYILMASSPREHRWITEEEKEYIEAGLNISESKKTITPWRHILRSKPVWALLAPQVGFAICFTFFLTDAPTYLDKGLGISLKSSALLASLPYVGMWASSTAAGYASEKFYNKGLLQLTTCRKLFQSISFFGVAIGLLVLSFLDSEKKSCAVICLIISLTVFGASTAGFVVNQLDLSPNYAGVIMSLHNFFSTMGGAIIPILTSAILQNDPTNISRWRLVFLMIAGITPCTGVIYLIFATSERQPWDDPKYVETLQADREQLAPVLENDMTTNKDAAKTIDGEL
ncbi:unnamed protein product [Diatraea saccharalis]|uniref:Major facilitator superfamily (MFS) profile domain-containing protein n=1 Tax=Diatraea saccharalis TaxID=40085 RepID=A0A9N9QZ33_9NEOP|nr:unnamed protein product [Diatraea saccharalis]